MKVLDVLRKFDFDLTIGMHNMLVVRDKDTNMFYPIQNNKKLIEKINDELSKYKYSFYYETSNKDYTFIDTPTYVERFNNITAKFIEFKPKHAMLNLLDNQFYALSMKDDSGNSVYLEAELFETESGVVRHIEQEIQSYKKEIDSRITLLNKAYESICLKFNEK